MAKSDNMRAAQKAKNDEFYTQLTDISNELKYYTKYFKDKIVYCNCDDPTWSAFWRYFHLKFDFLGLKKLISTHYDAKEATYKLEYTGGDDNNIEAGVKTPLQGNGDFRNQECIDILKEADIVCTNPPFSLWLKYIAQLLEYDKKFLIIGNFNSVYHDAVLENKMWPGYTGVKSFLQPDGSLKSFGNIIWYTNLDVSKRHEKLLRECWKTFNQDDYPMYDNYCAWNIDKMADIFVDEDIEVIVDEEKYELLKQAYDSDCESIEKIDNNVKVRIHHPIMGVPISFLCRYNPDEFEIVGCRNGNDGTQLHYAKKDGAFRWPYTRVLIRRK